MHRKSGNLFRHTKSPHRQSNKSALSSSSTLRSCCRRSHDRSMHARLSRMTASYPSDDNLQIIIYFISSDFINLFKSSYTGSSTSHGAFRRYKISRTSSYKKWEIPSKKVFEFICEALCILHKKTLIIILKNNIVAFNNIFFLRLDHAYSSNPFVITILLSFIVSSQQTVLN